MKASYEAAALGRQAGRQAGSNCGLTAAQPQKRSPFAKFLLFLTTLFFLSVFAACESTSDSLGTSNSGTDSPQQQESRNAPAATVQVTSIKVREGKTGDPTVKAGEKVNLSDYVTITPSNGTVEWTNENKKVQLTTDANASGGTYTLTANGDQTVYAIGMIEGSAGVKLNAVEYDHSGTIPNHGMTVQVIGSIEPETPTSEKEKITQIQFRRGNWQTIKYNSETGKYNTLDLKQYLSITPTSLNTDEIKKTRITWTSDNEEVAHVDQEGVVTGISGYADANIRATVKSEFAKGNVTKAIPITVEKKPDPSKRIAFLPVSFFTAKISSAFRALAASDSVISISSAEELAAVAANVNNGTDDYSNKTVELTADIDLSSYTDWTSIGFYDSDSSANNKPFAGIFDGKGYTISGLAITTSGNCKGLFGYNTGTVKNFTIKGTIGANGTPVGGNYYGGAIACNTGTVSEIKGQVDIYVGGSGGNTMYVGGIVGYSKGGTIEKCSNSGVITGLKDTKSAGGICGELVNGGTITECYNTANLNCSGSTAQEYGVGGIVGCSRGSETEAEKNKISYCYNTGTISNGGTGNAAGKSGAGGIAGSGSGYISYCYTTGNAEGAGRVGVVIGKIVTTTLLTHVYALESATVQFRDDDANPITTITASSLPEKNDGEWVYSDSSDGWAIGRWGVRNNNYHTGKVDFIDCHYETADFMQGKVTNELGEHFVDLLNGSTSKFKAVTNGYPILSWQ